MGAQHPPLRTRFSMSPRSRHSGTEASAVLGQTHTTGTRRQPSAVSVSVVGETEHPERFASRRVVRDLEKEENKMDWGMVILLNYPAIIPAKVRLFLLLLRSTHQSEERTQKTPKRKWKSRV